MTQRSASEIERDLDRTRAEMSQTIDAIQERLSPGQLFEQGMRYFYSGGGRSVTDGAAEFAQNFGRAIRDNPIPFALVATGLVWMMMGRGRQPSSRYDVYEDYAEYDALEDYDEYPEEEPLAGDWPADYRAAGRRYERESDVAAPAPSAATADAPAPVSAAGDASPHRGALGGSVGAASVGEQRAQEAARQAGLASGTDRREHDEEATRRAREAAEEARRQAMRADQAADEARRHGGDGNGEPRGGVRGRAQAAREWAGETAGGTRQRMQRAAEGTRRRFGRAGRTAREAAQSTRSGVRRARGTFTHMLEERPLLVGAIGLAIGAALGAALPASRREDEWFGDAGDKLKQRAREELEKGRRVAQRAYDTALREAERQGLSPEGAREAAREAARDAERAATERIREAASEAAGEAAQDVQRAAGDRVKDIESRVRKVGDAVTHAAKDEAERQHVVGTGGKSASREPGTEPSGEDVPGRTGGDSPDKKQI